MRSHTEMLDGIAVNAADITAVAAGTGLNLRVLTVGFGGHLTVLTRHPSPSAGRY
jgi:hypothetical protein